MRTPGKQFRIPQNLLKVRFQRQEPSPVKDAEPCSGHSRADQSTRGRSWRTLQPAPATLQRLAGQHTAEAWGSSHQNINGFSLSTLASIPNWYYCCSLHYRTNYTCWLRGFYKVGRARPTDSQRGRNLRLLEWKMLLLCNPSEIVRDKAQELREWIIKRREKRANSWDNWNNMGAGHHGFSL